MSTVKLTIVESQCKSGLHKEGQEFLVKDTCPPMCHELWQCIYPQVYALSNGGRVDNGNAPGSWFNVRCPSGGRVMVMGKLFEDN